MTVRSRSGQELCRSEQETIRAAFEEVVWQWVDLFGGHLSGADLSGARLKMASKRILRERLTRALNTLGEREREVLKLRFGLEDGCPRTLSEVGQILGVTGERIRQIEAKAINKLKHPQRSKRLRDYLE